jgi:amidophosphoribosyltransferase
MPSREELVAARIPEARWAEAFGVDSVTFLSVEGLRGVVGGGSCMACFDGRYPVPVSEDEAAAIVADRRNPSARASA